MRETSLNNNLIFIIILFYYYIFFNLKCSFVKMLLEFLFNILMI